MKRKIYLSLRIVLPIIGFIIGGAKIVGVETEVYVFNTFGVPDWFRVVFGIVQIVGGVFIIVPLLETTGIIVSIALFVIVAALMVYNLMFFFLIAPLIGLIVLYIYIFLRKEYYLSLSSD